ncbi:SapB/AmfS family lanthipeptide [Streptomyces sp. SID3343]|nr:SapB/AmfS family lanthipeptide [Streptomyces sp. SID3343]MYW05148.1 SapB/AmfS family lantipeptide [Streptomyces sp. SID3343]
MTLLDLQTMATPAIEDGGELANGGGGGGGSRASLLLCGNSSLSLVTCN